MKRILKTFVSICMILCMCLISGCGSSSEDNENTNIPVENQTYVLEGSSLTAFSAGEKTDGTEEMAGTDNYFTIIYSAKSKVDSSEKTFEDEYASSQRINLGGKATLKKNSIKFVTKKAATIKVWWVEGGEDHRQIGILDESGNVVSKTAETLDKNMPCVSTLEVTKAGTYYLGGIENNNYFFKVEVIEVDELPAIVNEYILETKDLTPFAAGTKIDGNEEQAGTNNFFTLIYSEKTKVDSSSKSFSDGYETGQRVNFGGEMSTEKNAVKFTIDGTATVKVWWVEGGENNRQMAILDASGNQVAVTSETLAKNQLCISTLEIPSAGTYYLGGDIGNNYIFKVHVMDSVSASAQKAPRAAWSTVKAPEINNIKPNEGKVEIEVNSLIGHDGADKVVAYVYDKDGNMLQEVTNSKEGNTQTITIELASSGTYSFLIKGVRDGEEAKESERKEYTYSLPLASPMIKTINNAGNGSLALTWNEVKEATGYEVSIVGTNKKVTTTELNTVIKGLTIGESVKASIVALRNQEKSSAVESEIIKITKEEERPWSFAAFGTSTNTTSNGYEGSVKDGKVTIYSEDGKGKSVPTGTDGLAFYYTTIDPKNENFTLRANVHVDSWTFSNGQESFGLMVADAVGTHGSSADFWNNSIQAIGTKIEYRYDGKGETTDTSYPKYSMKLGLGTIVKLGVTPEGIEEKNAGKVSSPTGFTSSTYTLETSASSKNAGTYNLVGNATKPVDGTLDTALVDFVLEIQRNNTGYIVRYLTNKGEIIGEKLIYDLERNALTRIDKDNIYVGFFAARNMRITVTDIKLTTIDPKKDTAAEERKTEYVAATYLIDSASSSNSEDYTLVFYGNADGRITIKDASGEVYAENVLVKANEKASVKTKIALGTTEFHVTMTPDASYVPGKYKKLDNYNSVTLTYPVTYQKFEGTNIYVAQSGSPTNKGSKNSPVDIYTAVKYVAPGQKIILAGGTYTISNQIKVERGINGTPSQMIYMIADPSAATRPIFDFNKKGSGMILGGDYWYFQGFDVTGTKNGQKGLQLSGSNCVLDDIHAYKNGNTGIQISRYRGTDTKEEWPSNNEVLNCVSYLNADAGYEDADGFAAKLTVGEGNVFDGCVSAYNADDGWDLYAKTETGSIGLVTIKNSIAYKNGYVLYNAAGELNLNGKEQEAGNGNGFKMGGESLSGKHVLINSIAFENKAKGIDSNSCPDIEIYDSTSFNNGSYNIALYTNNAINTAFKANNILSIKTNNTAGDNFKVKGNQNEANYKNETTYYFNGSQTLNTTDKELTVSVFESIEVNAVELLRARNENNTINIGNFLQTTSNNGADFNSSKLKASKTINVDRTKDVTKHYVDATTTY